MPRGRISTTTKASTKNTTTRATRQPITVLLSRKTPITATSQRIQSSTSTTTEPVPKTVPSTASTRTTTTTTSATTTTTKAEPPPTTVKTTQHVETRASTPSTVSTTTRLVTRTSYRGLPRRPIYSSRRMQPRGDASKRLDYHSSYYYAISQTERRLGDLLNKQIQRSREDDLKLWKEVYSVKAGVRKVDRNYNVLKRNITGIAGKVRAQSKDLDKYQDSHKQKIDQIETHQGSQDKHYYEVYQTTANNSRQIDDLVENLGKLGPIVADIAVKVEETNEREQKALEMLSSHTRDSFAGMSNQIRVQQRTVASLGNQVRTELDLLHAVKQSMSRRMEQNQRKLSEDVNAHLSTHTSQINRVETALNRQAERIKHLNAIVRRHNQVLDSDDLIDISLMKHVDNITNYLGMMYTNLTRVSVAYYDMQGKVTSMEKKLAVLGTTTHRVTESFANQSRSSSQLHKSVTTTAQEVERISNHLHTLTQKHDDESKSLRSDLDKALETQKIHQKNISAIIGLRADDGGDQRLSRYLADEPAADTPLHVTETFGRLLIELGVEDRISRLTRVMRLQQHRMANVTKVVRKIAQDKDEITDTTTHYLSIIKSQADVIKDQNKTIAKLAMMVSDQDMTIGSLGDELMLEQENLRKLSNIIANMAAASKNPMASQRDCHDLWLNGHRESGVYNIIENMKLRPVQCNMTAYGGWTVIQNRRDGSQDFDLTYEEYRQGFGDVYDEYWLGLDGIRTITQKVRTNTALRIILEDWNSETRTATYSRFYLYGKGYGISISGYEGDAGDSLSSANGLQFSAKVNDNDYGNACNSMRRAGWWFSSPQHNCGACNLNGEYRRFADIKTPGSSAIYWKSWHGSGYPMRRASMQIIPREVLDNLNELSNDNLDTADDLEGVNSVPKEDTESDNALSEESYRDGSEDSSLSLPSLDYNVDYDGLFMDDG